MISLAGIADITQKYIDHAPFVQHPAAQRLGSANEYCLFRVFGRASICLTHLDDMHERANWNTFSMWWVHTYPWWPARTIIGLALALLAVFLASGGALLAVLAPPARWLSPSASSDPYHPSAGTAGQGKSSRRPGAGTPLTAAAPAQPASPPPHTPLSHGPGTRVVVARPARRAVAPFASAMRPVRRAVSPFAPAMRPATGLGPLGLAVLVAALTYGTIVGGAAVRAPLRAPPLYRVVPMAAMVYDGSWGYRVLGVTSLRRLPGGLVLPPTGWHDLIVQLLLRNLSTRPPEMRPAFFGLADAAGTAYPAAKSLDGPVAELYHVLPLWRSVPPRSVVQSVLVYLVPGRVRHLVLLGPGIALIQLIDPRTVDLMSTSYLTACHRCTRLKRQWTSLRTTCGWPCGDGGSRLCPLADSALCRERQA